MHLIILLIIVVVILLVMLFKSPSGESQYSSISTADKQEVNANNTSLYHSPMAWIADGKLYFRRSHGDVQQIQSEYVQNMLDRVEKNRQRNAWKENTTFQVSANQGWNQRMGIEGLGLGVRFSSAVLFEKELLYFLQDENFGGLFSYNFEEERENRLLHSQHLSLVHLVPDPDRKKVLCSQYNEDGISNIAVMNLDGSDLQNITEGDTADTEPYWVPGRPDEIVFQSSGIARTPEGYVAAFGPCTLQLLNIKTGDMQAVLDNERFDFMQPRVNAAGDLHFIRRPYSVSHYDGLTALGDIVLFPFRLLRAVFHYLNFFSLMYTRKPLSNAGGPKAETDIKDILLKGKRIDAEKALRKESAIQGVPSLVPRSWELVRRTANGKDTILATNVACYAIDSQDKVVYSNGYAVFSLDEENQSQLIHKGSLISDVVLNSNG